MRLCGWRWLSILIIFGVLSGGSASTLADGYTYTSFGYPGSSDTSGSGINNSGQVVGNGPLDGFAGFLYDNGNFSVIRFPGSGLTEPYAISNSGLIVGSYDVFFGFLYDHGIYTTIMFPGSEFTVPFGVNSKGQMVGRYDDASGSHGFLFDGSSYQKLDIPGYLTSAIGINDLGQILVGYNFGWAIDDGGIFSPILLPSSDYMVTGFNNLDQIVGNLFDNSGNHGFVDDHGVIQIFQVPESVTPEVTHTFAAGINDFGQITGRWWAGSLVNNPQYAYVATPVPEPGTLGLAASGFVILAGAIRRKHLA